MNGRKDKWIEEDIKKYKEIYQNYEETEIALSHYAFNMVKILNGLSEIGMTEFYKYERQILWDAIKLFSKYCMERIWEALRCGGLGNKKRIIMDIEDSFVQIMDVCKTIFDGTANAERQMFQSTLVDTNLYDLSPKICAFYSNILKKVVQLFANGEYAFVLYPTLRGTTEAKILLKTREDSGKVVIVCISENEIERFNVMPIYLLHEAFHVITKEERLREERAGYLVLNLIEYMELFLFDQVEFPDEEKGREIRKKLMEYWFDDVLEWKREWKGNTKNDRMFYSERIWKELANKIKFCLANINANLDDDMLEFSYEVYENEGYASFRKDMKRLKEVENQIRDNINSVVLGNMVSEVGQLMIFLYKETYADIACILTLELEAKKYEDAFVRSIQIGDKGKDKDIKRWARQYLVAEAISKTFLGKDKGWEEYLERLKEEINNWKKKEKQTRQNDEKCGNMIPINLTSSILKQFGNYLERCVKVFSQKLEQIEGTVEFREYVRNILAENESQVLVKILSGTVDFL